MKYRVGLTKNLGGDVEAWVFDVPGCWTVTPEVAGIGPLLPVVIAEHLAWLERHGETIADASPIEVEIIEEVDAKREAEFCFAADHVPVTSDEMETAIRRMGFARRDLLDLVTSVADPGHPFTWAMKRGVVSSAAVVVFAPWIRPI